MMIDWQQMEVQAIYAGAKDHALIQRTDCRELLTDLQAGFRRNIDGKTTCSPSMWSIFDNCKILGREHCQKNGLSKVMGRAAKAEKAKKLVETHNRLTDPNDPCTDLIGDGYSKPLINEAELCKRVESMYSSTTRFKSLWRSIDPMLTNYRTGSVLSLCGLSGTGKTNLAMQLTYFAGYKTLYFGVDMSVFGFGDRLIKTKWYRENLGAMFPFGERTECDLQVERMAKTGKLKLDDGIRTYDCDSMTLEKIEYIAREEMKSFKADFVVIDYVGRIDSEKNVKDQWREDQAIARAIKGIAKRLDVRVISLVQFSSKAEKYKKPDFSWMSGSKEIISASDIVLCMWQDKKQGSAGDETDHSHIWVSDDIKSRDSGTHGNVRLETYGLWLYEGDL